MTRTDIINRMAEANRELSRVELQLPQDGVPSQGQLNEMRFQESILVGLCRDLFKLVNNEHYGISMNE